MVPVAVGVDFGTTNSVVAIADRSGQVQVRRFDTQVGAVEAYRSALLFFREGRPPNATLEHISGPDALLRATDIDADHRFLQSLKTYLSSATLLDVYLLGRRFLLEELIGVLLKDILPAGIGDLPVDFVEEPPVVAPALWICSAVRAADSWLSTSCGEDGRRERNELRQFPEILGCGG
jgi:hypothetical chaperone protein